MNFQEILQDKKKLVMIVGGVLFLIVVVIIIILSGSNSNTAPVGNANPISKVILAKGITSDKKPINPTSAFSINDPEIDAIITLNNLSAGVIVNYQWYNVDQKKVLQQENVSSAVTISGTTTSVITRNPDTPGHVNWGLGNYEFRISLNGQLIVTKKFTVQTDQDIANNLTLASIKDVQLTTAVDLQGNPTKSVSNVFSKDDQDIYSSISYSNLFQTTSFEEKWIFVDSDYLIAKYQKNINGSGNFAFGIDSKRDSWIPTQKWPVGKYRLEIYLDSTQINSIDFEIN